MMMCVRNRYFKIGIYILVVIVPLVLFSKMNRLLLEKSQLADKLQGQNEQLQKKYSDIIIQAGKSIEYNKELNEKLINYSKANLQITDQIEKWKFESTNEIQAFHGEWWINVFYTSAANGKQAYEGYRTIAFRQRYIYMTDDHITDEPIYTATICNREKILIELLDMGIEDGEIINLLESDYYVEMDFSNTYCWNRTAFPGEADFIENSRYYPINSETMLCFSRNDGGKVYVLHRLFGVND